MSQPESGTIAFAMKYPDDQGNVWSRIGALYDRVAQRLAGRGLRGLLAFPALTDRPAFATPHLERCRVDLLDFTPAHRPGLKHWLLERKVKLVFYCDVEPSLVDLGLLRGLGIPTINFAQYNFPEIAPPWAKRLFNKVRGLLRLKMHDLTLANSRHQYEFLTGWAGLPASRVRLACNGVDTDVFVPAAAGQRPPAAALGLPGSDLYALICCQSRPEKRVDFLIEVAAEVFRRRPGLSLTFVYVGDGGLKPTWMGKAQSLKLGPRFHFAGQQSHLTPFYQRADLFLHAPSRESFGYVLGEAMACGLPVISSNAGGPREIVVPGETGWLLPPEDKEGFVKHVLELVDDAGLRQRLGAAGRQRVLKHFSMAAQADTVAAAIGELVR